MKFAAIADWADSGAFPVDFMCAQLEVSRSGYYAWRGRDPSERAQTDEKLLAVIKSAYVRLRGNPGVRRLHAELTALGHHVPHKRVWRRAPRAGRLQAAPAPLVPAQPDRRRPLGQVARAGRGVLLQRGGEHPALRARRGPLVHRAHVHQPPAIGVELDPLDRQPFKPQQQRQ